MAQEPDEMAEEMPPIIPIPLAVDPIEAAADLRLGYAPLWRTCGDALDALAIAFPDFDPESALLKAAALRQLYNAGPYSTAAFESIVNNIVGVMAYPLDDPVAIVNAIAAIPEGNHYVFASKFVHFFVAPYGAVPMLDRKWVTRRLRYHFEQPLTLRYDSYDAFYADADMLRASVFPGDPGFRELDYYLWLAGMYAAWPALPSPISPEFVALFANPDAGPLLGALLGE